MSDPDFHDCDCCFCPANYSMAQGRKHEAEVQTLKTRLASAREVIEEAALFRGCEVLDDENSTVIERGERARKWLEENE